MTSACFDGHLCENGGPAHPAERAPLDSRVRSNDLDRKSPDLFPPRDIEPERLEAGRLLFARDWRFVAGAATEAALPAEGLPEIAFLGRSNVGKSSLVNALTGRRMLARTSNTPGRTRQLNFFALDGRLMLVDLPGYGYAAASKTAIATWTRLVRHYLRRRASLRRVCLLIDSRHGIKETDRPVMALCDAAGLSFQVVLTKIDEIAGEARGAIAERIAAELARHPAAHPEIHLTSAEQRLGIAALRATLAAVAEPAMAAASKAG
jgi:GTP-binding protein